MGNNIDQTCTFFAETKRSVQFFNDLSKLNDWNQEDISMPIPDLSEYAEDVDSSRVLSLHKKSKLAKFYEACSTDIGITLGVFVQGKEKSPYFIPSKKYIDYLQENQFLKGVSDYDESGGGEWSVTFTSNWSPVFEYFDFLGLMGITVHVDYFDEMPEYAGEYSVGNYKKVDKCFYEDEGKLYLIKKWQLSSLDEYWFMEVASYDSFDEYNEDHTPQHPELIALIKKYYQNETKDLSGQNIVFTGTMSQSRTQMKKEAEEAGAKILSDVSSKVDLLVCGAQIVHNATNAKYKKAKKLDIETIEEEEYRQRFFSGENEEIFEEEEENHDKEAFFAFYTKSKLTDILDELGDTDYRSSWKKSKLVSLILEYTIKNILSSFTSNELKEGLERLNLSSTGRKNERYKRLCDALAE